MLKEWTFDPRASLSVRSVSEKKHRRKFTGQIFLLHDNAFCFSLIFQDNHAATKYGHEILSDFSGLPNLKIILRGQCFLSDAAVIPHVTGKTLTGAGGVSRTWV